MIYPPEFPVIMELAAQTMAKNIDTLVAAAIRDGMKPDRMALVYETTPLGYRIYCEARVIEQQNGTNPQP